MMERPAKLQNAIMDEALAAAVVGCIGSPMDLITACPAAFGIAFQITRLVSLPVQIFLHHTFGERYLTSGNVFFMLGVMYVLAGYAGPREVILAMPAVCGFAIAYLVVSCLRLCGIYRRIRENVPVHSYSNGHPWPFFFRICRNEDVIKRYIEPVTCVLVGFVLAQVTPVGVFIALSGVFLLIHSHLQHMLRRKNFLDARDAQIEAQIMQERLQERPGAQAAGVAVAASLGGGTQWAKNDGRPPAAPVVRLPQPRPPQPRTPGHPLNQGTVASDTKPEPSKGEPCQNGSPAEDGNPSQTTPPAPEVIPIVSAEDPALGLSEQNRVFAREQIQQGNIVVRCPATGCSNVMAFKPSTAGRRARCHEDGTVFRVPQAPANSAQQA